MGLLLKGGINRSLLSSAVLAASVIVLILGMIRAWSSRQKQPASSALQLGSCVGNTAYFGIPVALALLPSDVLTISIGYDFGATLLTWGLGPLWLAESQQGSRQDRWRMLFNHLSSSPATRGLLGATIVMATPWKTAVTDSLWLPSRIVIVMALMVVGMRLASLCSQDSSETPHHDSFHLNAALGFKLLLFPACMFGISLMLPISTAARQALVLQAAAPTAISVLLIAETEQADSDGAAKLILRSTILAMITVPIWAILLQSMGEKL